MTSWKIKDFLWNNKSLLLPFGSAVLAAVWLYLDYGPEPFVVLATSILAFSVSYHHDRDVWYSTVQGDFWIFGARFGASSHADSFINECRRTCSECVKLSVRRDGEFIRLSMDSLKPIDHAEIRQTALRLGGKLYFAEKNGKRVWEYEEI